MIMKINYRELLIQAMIGFIYGYLAGYFANVGTKKALLVGLAGFILKGLVHALIKLVEPSLIREGRSFKYKHWTEKIERIL